MTVIINHSTINIEKWIIVKLPMKGNLTATLLSSPSKLFTRVLLNRLQKMLWGKPFEISKQVSRKVANVHVRNRFLLQSQIEIHKIKQL